MEQAFREQWAISDAAKAEALDAVMAILRDPEAGRRSRLAAVRVLVAANAQNLDQQRINLLANVTSGDTAAAIVHGAYELIHGRRNGGSDPGDGG